MATLTLAKSRNALAVLAWKRGMTIKPFSPGRRALGVIPVRVHSVPSKLLTTKQAMTLKRR